MAKLTAQNYSVSLCGDFNSWLGTTGPYGMPENRDHINPNGQLLIDFMTPRNIKLANKFEQAEGVYTRFPDRKECKPSVLDLVLLEEEMYSKLTAFVVDEDNTYGVTSDHRLVLHCITYIIKYIIFYELLFYYNMRCNYFMIYYLL